MEEAQRRRARRAEAARLKYHRMTSEERKRFNAARDAQRRRRLHLIVTFVLIALIFRGLFDYFPTKSHLNMEIFQVDPQRYSRFTFNNTVFTHIKGPQT